MKKQPKSNIQALVADAILQRPRQAIEVGGVKYPIAPPTPATLILVSELVAQMPSVDKKAGNVVAEVLHGARDMAIVGQIAATLMLGAKRIKERRMVEAARITETRRWSWRKMRRVTISKMETTTEAEADQLARLVLEEVTNAELLQIISKALGLMELGDFFQLTAFLSEANLTKPTREAVTAPGE